MFRELRRKDKKLDDSAVLDILNNSDYGVLGTISENDYPYTVPMNYVFLNGNIYLHSAKSGHKIDNLKNNKKISFTIVSESKIIPKKFSATYKSVSIMGKAYFIDNDEKKKALIAFIDKYSPAYKKSGIKYIDRTLDKVEIIKIEIKYLKGKNSDG